MPLCFGSSLSWIPEPTGSNGAGGLVWAKKGIEAGAPTELVVEDRPGAFEAVAAAVGAGSVTVVSGTAVRQGHRRPVLLIRSAAPAAADLRRRLEAAGHPPVMSGG